MDWLPVVSSAVLATLGFIAALATYHKWYGSKVVESTSAHQQRSDISDDLALLTVWFKPPGPGEPDFTIPTQLRELHADMTTVKQDVSQQTTRLKQHLDEESMHAAAALKREQARDGRIDTLFSKLVDPKRH